MASGKKWDSLRRSRTGELVRFCLRYLANGWPEWVGVLLLSFTLGIAINSIQQAQWISPQPSLLTVLILSVVLAFATAKSRLRLVETVLIGFIAGLIVTVWQAASVAPAVDEGPVFSRLFNSLSSLWQNLNQNTPDKGTIYFALFLIVITWILGYISIWRFIRKNSFWPAVFLGLIALLVNLDFLSQSAYGYFFLYLFAGILLVSFTGFLKHYFTFRLNGIRYPVRGVLWFVALVVCMSAVLIGVSWAAPEIRANQLQNATDARVQVGKTLDSLRLNLFAPVKAKGAIIKSVDQSQLSFSTPPNLSRDVQFTVIAPRTPSYWRVRRYDVYNANGWSASPAVESVIESGISPDKIASAAPNSTMTYTVINKIKSDVVLTAGPFIAADNTLLKHSFAGTDISPAIIEDETVFLSTPRIYKPDEGYSITVGMLRPSQTQLAEAGIQYPKWITDRYLQIPNELPQSVKRLGPNISRRMQNPYDKVIAIRMYLAQLAYTENGTFPPAGSDAVENFLTVQKSGNCTNFATAAVVLLRTAGIPARFCTGYIPHTWDQKNATFLVEARDYHAWPEVYFPGYGWMEFEVTPGSVTNLVSPESNLDLTGAGNSDPNNLYYDESLFAPDGSSIDPSAALPQENSILPILYTVIAFLLLALGVEYGLRSWYLKFKRADYTAEVYAKLHFVASMMQLSASPQQTPQEYAEQLAGFVPEQKEAIFSITGAYTDYRYGGNQSPDIKKIQELNHSWRVISGALLKKRFSSFFRGFNI
jgi:transglutaminase-like putative cysteine protease